MQFLNALVKGLGWSLGLGLGFMITAIAYQTYEDYRVGGWVDRIETAYPDQVAVSNSDLETLELTLLKQAVMNGSVLVSGELKNTLERPLQFAGVAAMIRYEEVTIEKCHGISESAIPAGSVGTISIICEKDWSDLDHTKMEISLKLTAAHYQDV